MHALVYRRVNLDMLSLTTIGRYELLVCIVRPDGTVRK